ncbi:unnamed protein product [Orchesella dallaii]|uniref:Protein kinase domain-containing protein n=1 Tax=Orchesella dallaii TaxID=48710 RepID=A0ABP1PP12_9HEXA
MKALKLASWRWVLFLGVVLVVGINQIESQEVLLYNPWVLPEDNPDLTASYTLEDVKVQLQLIIDNGFHHIATYTIGAPADQYVANFTSEKSSSIVHTAIAASQINREKGQATLTVFQGLYTMDYSELRIHSEIEVGFEVAAAANLIYAGTVTAIVLPSWEKFNVLLTNVNLIRNVSIRARSIGLQFGTRLLDCIDQIPLRDVNDKAAHDLIGLFDFIVCRKLPTFNSFPVGPTVFRRIITNEIHVIENAVHNEMKLKTQIILETGWPGGLNLNGQNTIRDMLHFWELIRTWAKREGRIVFLYEALDSPWRDSNNLRMLFGGHYGLWTHSGVQNFSRSSYIWKPSLLQQGAGAGAAREESEGVYKGNMQIMAIILASIIFMLVAVMMMVAALHQKVKKLKDGKLNKEEIREFHEGSVPPTTVETGSEECAWARLPYNQKFELAKEDFVIESTLLGKGEYGSVYKGRLEIEGSVNYVAIKRTTFDSKIFALRALLCEIKVLSYLGKHENIVGLSGAYTAELAKGCDPYAGQGYDENFVSRLEIGLRLESPLRMPSETQEIMTRSWHREPAQRPTFEEIREMVSTLLEKFLQTTSDGKSCVAEINENVTYTTTTTTTPLPDDYLQVGYIDIECVI